MWICKKCGAENFDNLDKCVECGTSKEQKPEPRKKIIIAAVVIAAIAVLAIALIRFVSEEPKYPITLVAVSDEKMYDGEPLINGEIKASELADESHVFSADCEIYDSNGNSISGGPVDIGDYVKKVGNVHIYSKGKDITDQYDITTVDGMLSILPTPTPTPESAPTPTPEPAPTPESAPSAADLEAINSEIEYPKEDEYKDSYKYAIVKAPHGHSVYGFGSADHLGSSYTVLDGEKVLILAERKGYSCVIVLSQNKGRWINSQYLFSEEDTEEGTL